MMLELQNVHKTYHGGNGIPPMQVLHEINITVKQGEYVSVMGPSGSGKTTLMNIMGCLDRPSKGNYFINGQDVARLDDMVLAEMRCRIIGFVFQAYNLIPQLSVLENIEMPLYYQGISEKISRQKAEGLAAVLGLEPRLNHKPLELSGGQQQRVAIARALANDPLIIFADEPTGNLDSKTGEEVFAILEAQQRKGRTLIVVTHDQTLAKRAERIIRMHDGRIVDDTLNIDSGKGLPG